MLFVILSVPIVRTAKQLRHVLRFLRLFQVLKGRVSNRGLFHSGFQSNRSALCHRHL